MKPASWADVGPRRWPNAVFALRSEPRVSWCMHVPEGFKSDPDAYDLVVAVHGTGRGAQAYRDAFARDADRRRWVVLAPLFPVGVLGDGNADGYKRLQEGALRYDQLLLEMVDEVGEVLAKRFERFNLFGFSGGGHFAHRFFYLHPERLRAVCVGACGGITRLDAEQDWWLGVRNVRAVFDREIDIDRMRRVPAQLLIGERDREVLPIPPQYLSSLGDIEPTRMGLSDALLADWRRHGLAVEQVVVPGVAHEGLALVERAAQFFERV